LVLNNLTRDCTVKANFELNEITVTISSGLGGSTDPDGVIKVKQGEGLAIRAKALKGYRFTHWSCDIADCSGIGSSLNLSSLKSDCQVTAHFVDDQQPQKLNASPKQISTTIFYLVVILLCAVQFFRFFQLFQPSTELGLQDPNFGDLHLVVSGTFTQGTGTDPNHESDETPFTHTLTRNILVMETEVSRQMWADLKSAQPSLPNDPTKTSYGSGMNNPVQNNTWYEAVLFANLLSVERGFTRCYYKDASYTTPVDSTNYTSGSFYCNFDANGYRLPTEGEWEYFTRAGTTGPFSIDEPNYYSGNCSSCTSGTFPNLESVAVFCGNDAGRSEPVGSKDPNPWGLKDVHGNVWEWCWDWYSNNYPSGSATDYEGATSGSIRVVRGGSWMNGAWSCRSAIRAWNTPSNRIYNLGFRLVRTDP
jgi:formylglycine-generating enzyme required for sulfatase activity